MQITFTQDALEDGEVVAHIATRGLVGITVAVTLTGGESLENFHDVAAADAETLTFTNPDTNEDTTVAIIDIAALEVQ